MRCWWLGVAAWRGCWRAPTLALHCAWAARLFLLGYGLLAWQRALFAADAGVRAGGARVARGWLGVVGGLAGDHLLNPMCTWTRCCSSAA